MLLVCSHIKDLEKYLSNVSILGHDIIDMGAQSFTSMGRYESTFPLDCEAASMYECFGETFSNKNQS